MHEKLLRKKLPEKLRGPLVTFKHLREAALKHSKEENGQRSTRELELKLAIIASDFDDRAADGITKEDIQTWLLEQTEVRSWSPATRNRYHAAFSLVFRVALDNEKVQSNPASRIKRKPEHNDRIRFLTDDEEAELTKVLRIHWPHYLPVFLFSIHTGLRLSEQLGLKWSDISLARKTVSLHRAKAGKTRHVQLNSVALACLENLPGDHLPSAPVFLNSEGNALRSSRDWFEPAIVKAKLRDYTWHCNRHTFASRLVMNGADITTVAKLMGHSTIQMTMRYAHLAPDHVQSAVDRLVRPKLLATKSVTRSGSRKRA